MGKWYSYFAWMKGYLRELWGKQGKDNMEELIAQFDRSRREINATLREVGMTDHHQLSVLVEEQLGQQYVADFDLGGFTWPGREVHDDDSKEEEVGYVPALRTPISRDVDEIDIHGDDSIASLPIAKGYISPQVQEILDKCRESLDQSYGSSSETKRAALVNAYFKPVAQELEPGGFFHPSYTLVDKFSAVKEKALQDIQRDKDAGIFKRKISNKSKGGGGVVDTEDGQLRRTKQNSIEMARLEEQSRQVKNQSEE